MAEAKPASSQRGPTPSLAFVYLRVRLQSDTGCWPYRKLTMAKRDYYEVLGIQRGADEAAIKKVYRRIAMKYHPDRNPGDKAAEEMFKEANEAYSVLSDPQKKSAYDQFGHAAVDGQYMAVDEGGRRAGEEQGGAGNLIWPRPALHRNALAKHPLSAADNI